MNASVKKCEKIAKTKWVNGKIQKENVTQKMCKKYFLFEGLVCKRCLLYTATYTVLTDVFDLLQKWHAHTLVWVCVDADE